MDKINRFNTVNEIEEAFELEYDVKYCLMHQTILDIYNENFNDLEEFDTLNQLVQCIIAEYYKCIKNDRNKMYEWHMLAIAQSSSESIYSLAIESEEIENYEEMIKYLKLGIQIGDVCQSILTLAKYFFECEKYDEMIKWYEFGIKLNNTYSMISLADYYLDYNLKTFDEVKPLYVMATKLNSNIAMLRIASYYSYEKNYDEMKQWYEMAIKINCIYSMYYLGTYYKIIEINYDLMKKYYSMIFYSFVNTDDKNEIICRIKDDYGQICENKSLMNSKNSEQQNLIIEYYELLLDINSEVTCDINCVNNIYNNETVRFELDNLKIDDRIQTYILRSNKAIINNIVNKCSICYENKLHIMFDNCVHGVCIQCYKKIIICPMCRKDI